MTSLYSSPDAIESPMPDLENKKRFWKRAIWWASASVILPPLVGIVVTVSRMMWAMGELALKGGDTGEMSHYVSAVLLGTTLGLMISIFGLIFLVIAIVRFCYYRKQCRLRE